MRAAVLHELGGTPSAEEFGDPSGDEDGEIVDVTIAGLNPVDVTIAAGSMPRVKPEVPYVLGREGIGTLAGSGGRVYFSGTVAPFGSFAERTVAVTDTLIDVPDGVGDAQAVAFGIAGMAGWIALEWRAGLRRGETVLVLGASGVVGQIAIQAARLLGASRVIAAARDEDSLGRLAELGADDTVAIPEDPADFTEALLEASGGGVDLIVDPVWGPPAVGALGAAARDGRLVQIGNAASPTAEIPAGGFRNRHATILGYTNFNVPEEIKADAFRRMCDHAARGDLRVEVEEVPLSRVADAWERQQSGPHHKLAIRP
jgi:NADPH:quinone reductase-like Zn-dependent oxidoreductase